MLNAYLDIGYTDIRGYWNLSMFEIITLLKAGARKVEREAEKQKVLFKRDVITHRNLSLMIGEAVACLFDKNKRELTSLNKYYPGLFEELDKPKEIDGRVYTEMWREYTEKVNSQRRQKGGVVDGVSE